MFSLQANGQACCFCLKVSSGSFLEHQLRDGWTSVTILLECYNSRWWRGKVWSFHMKWWIKCRGWILKKIIALNVNLSRHFNESGLELDSIEAKTEKYEKLTTKSVLKMLQISSHHKTSSCPLLPHFLFTFCLQATHIRTGWWDWIINLRI